VWWIGACALPQLALAQERPSVSGLADVTVQPWRLIDWTGATVSDTLGWAGQLFGVWKTLDPPLEGVASTSAFEEREAGTHDSRTLLSGQARASSPLWFGTVTGDLDFLALESPRSIGLGLESPRWLRVAVKEAWGPFTIGVRFESVSPGLERVTSGRVKGETEGGEAWVEGREGPVRLRLSGGQFWDNLTDYSRQPRTTKTQAGATLGITLPVGATLSVGYQGGLAKRQPGPRSRTALTAKSQTSQFDSVTTSLAWEGSAWNLTVSSTYSPSIDLRSADGATVSQSHDVSASFRLLPSFWITPALNVAEDMYEWSGIQSETTTASVSVSWTSILEGVDLSVWGSYQKSETSDDLFNATAINAAAGIVWRLPRVFSERTSLAFEAGSNHYFDAVTASAGYGEIYGVVTLRVKVF
jgi:hypothetical protein